MRMLATGLTGPDADEVVSAKLKFQSYAASRRVRAYDKHSLVRMFFREHHRYFDLREAVAMNLKMFLQFERISRDRQRNKMNDLAGRRLPKPRRHTLRRTQADPPTPGCVIKSIMHVPCFAF